MFDGDEAFLIFGGWMFEILAFGIALAALIFSRKALNRLREAEARISALEQGAPPQRTIVVSAPSPIEAPLAPTIEPEAEAIEAPPLVEPQEPPALPETPAEAEPAASATSPPPPPPSPGFEERLGTRWVVWVGGLTLALGGLFLVRYSIEAGLLGPAARVFFGGLFA